MIFSFCAFCAQTNRNFSAASRNEIREYIKNPEPKWFGVECIHNISDISVKQIFQYSYSFFFHPDFTVGPGISPGQPLARVADFTAGRELHPTPKKYILSGI